MSYVRSNDSSWNFTLIGGVVILTLTFLIVALVLSNALGEASFGAWGPWFGGTATSAAVIVALRVSRRDLSDREARDVATARTQSELYALYLMPRLTQIEAELVILQAKAEKMKSGSEYKYYDFEISHDLTTEHLFQVGGIDAPFARSVFELDHLLKIYDDFTGFGGEDQVDREHLDKLETQWKKIAPRVQEVTSLAMERSRRVG